VLLCERIAVLDAGSAAIMLRARKTGIAPPVEDPCELPAQPTQVQVEKALRDAERRIARLTDWLFDAQAAPPAPLRRELDMLLRATLRDALAVEKRLTTRADLSGMTRAKPVIPAESHPAIPTESPPVIPALSRDPSHDD
jgi:hypothetical protein